MTSIVRRLFMIMFVFLCVLPAGAQLGGLGKKKATGPSDQKPELSDADKKKVAEIESRPEVQALIRSTWDEVRRKDLDYAFAVNSSIRYSTSSVQQAVAFNNDYGQLYDNPILQRYLNNIGQRLVPKDSPNVYSFRIILDPVPRAEALSTGSVYVSTGLVALLDNEAQLSYVLAHEIAHIEKNHHYNEVKNTIIEDQLNQEREASAATKRAIFAGAVTAVGAVTGGATRGAGGAILGGALGLAGGSLVGQLLFRSKVTVTEWSEINENEADEAALPYMLAQNYDAREIPRLFVRMSGLTNRDSRVGLGFIARADRVKLRTSHMQELLSGSVKAQIDAKLKAGGLIASTPEFPLLMSALKRDNGIIALDYDLFAMARDNLEEAVNLRSNDARAHLYLGKVISITARTAEDRQEGMNQFLKAIQYDEGRGAYPDPHLERAIDMIAQNNPAQQDDIRKELQLYVALYQRENKGTLPSNMPIIYDYMQLAGDNSWYVAPTSVVSTKYVEALRVSSGGSSGPASVKDVIMSAEAPAGTAPTPVDTPKAAAPAPPKRKNVSSAKPSGQ
jgi:hypothetical protein